MKIIRHRQLLGMNRTSAFMAALLAVIITAAVAFGHGGKHAEKFTRLEALQNATGLYEKLIANAKLDQSWETGLKHVAISKRTHAGKDEIVVAFRRQEGDPMQVYIFFTTDGKYAGSNFTGE